MSSVRSFANPFSGGGGSRGIRFGETAVALFPVPVTRARLMRRKSGCSWPIKRVSFPTFDLVWVSFALDFAVRTQIETVCMFIIPVRLFLEVRVLTWAGVLVNFLISCVLVMVFVG